MSEKNICLISRSVYPHPISKHTQNMKTFEGWLRYWANVVVISQCQSSELCASQYKNIHGVLAITNKKEITRIKSICKKYKQDLIQLGRLKNVQFMTISVRKKTKKKGLRFLVRKIIRNYNYFFHLINLVTSYLMIP